MKTGGARARTGRSDSTVRDVESLNVLAAEKGKTKTLGRRVRCSHILIVLFLLVVSLDAYLQFHDTTAGTPEALPLSTPASADGGAGLVGGGDHPVLQETVSAVGQDDHGAAVAERGERRDHKRPRGKRGGERGGRARRRSGDHPRPDGDRPHDAGPSPSNVTAPDPSVDMAEVAKSLLYEFMFMPTFCAFERENISSKIVLTQTSVDSSNKVAYDKGGGQSQGKVNLDADFVRLLAKTNFLKKQGKSVCHETCAIVGNSGTMLRKAQGEEIDAHEAVMRINYPPTRRFEKNVGSKTTYDFSNRENARRMLRTRMRWRTPRTKVIFFEGSSPVNRRSIFGPLLKKHREQEFEFLHPQFVTAAQSLWFRMKRELEVRKGVQYHNKPMSGIYAVLFMLQVCQSVDLYGFEAYTKRTKDSPYHYFDSVRGVTSAHSFDLAIDVYKNIASVLPLDLK